MTVRHNCPECGASHAAHRSWAAYIDSKRQSSIAVHEFGKTYSELNAEELRSYNVKAQARLRARKGTSA